VVFALSQEEEQRSRDLHGKFLIWDCHSDIPLDVVRRRSIGESKVIERLHAQKLIAGGINANTAIMWCDDCSLAWGTVSPPSTIALRTIGLIREELTESKHLISQAKTAKEVMQAKKEGKVALIFGFEGTMPFENDLSYLQVFNELGVRIVTLTWNNRNLVADGCMERSNSGLSSFGFEVVKKTNELGMMIDLSHASTSAFFDVLECGKDPVICSHSNSRTICDHPRNLSDEQMKALAEKGGVIGMCFYPPHISRENPTIGKLLDHIDYISDLIGPEHIGIGADFFDYIDWPEYVRVCMAMRTMKRSPETVPAPIYPEGLQNASQMLGLTRGLVSRGFSDREIEGILGANFLRVFKLVVGE